MTNEELKIRLEKLEALMMAILNTNSLTAIVLANPDDQGAKDALYELAKINFEYINK